MKIVVLLENLGQIDLNDIVYHSSFYRTVYLQVVTGANNGAS